MYLKCMEEAAKIWDTFNKSNDVVYNFGVKLSLMEQAEHDERERLK